MVTTETDSKKDQNGSAPDSAAKNGASQGWTLKGAGISYLFADAALFTSGALASKWKEACGGVFGWMAGVVGARYGNPKPEKQLEQVERRLGAHLRKQGIEIPKDQATAPLTKKSGIFGRIESFLYKYPSQMMNVLYSLVGVQFLRSGMQHNLKDMKKSGLFLIAGALGGILIPEKKADPEHPPKGIFQKAWSWIQEKPLRLTGALFTANQYFLAKSALADHRANPGQKSYLFKLLAVIGFTSGNIMMALSPKSEGGRGKMDEKNRGLLVEACVRVIANQAVEKQNALLEDIAVRLASEPNVGMKAEEISALLHSKLTEAARAHPPVETLETKWVDRTAGASGAQLQQSF